MITFKQKGDFSATRSYLQDVLGVFGASELDKYGKLGVELLAEATPKRTGLTAASWKYVIEKDNKGQTITWYNTNIQNGQPIAIILQYGHTTSRGRYIKGRDYINPAIQPLFDMIADQAWDEVTKR